MEPVEEVHGLAHHKGVDEHGKANGLPQENVDDEDGDGDGDGGVAVEDPQAFGDAQVQHVPGGGADVGLDSQVDAEAVKKQAHRGQEHVEQDGPGAAVEAEGRSHGWITLHGKKSEARWPSWNGPDYHDDRMAKKCFSPHRFAALQNRALFCHIVVAMSIGRMIFRIIRCQTCRLAAKSIEFSIDFAIR